MEGSRVSGVAVSLVGAGLVAVGVWGRREVATALAREHITTTSDCSPPNAPVRTGTVARSLAESIRRSTLAATGGLTYGEVDTYLDAEGNPTSDRAHALADERTGIPVENPDHLLWVKSTTLQTALMQAYMGSRVAELTTGLGATLLIAGAGLAASSGHDHR